MSSNELIENRRRKTERVQKQESWKELVHRARERIRAELGERALTPPEEVIRQMREERDAQLLAMR
jgi:hypothetical protein